MNIHKNARLTRLRREEMALSVIEGGCSKAHAARVYGVTPKISFEVATAARDIARELRDLTGHAVAIER